MNHSIFPGIDTLQLVTLPGFPVERYEMFLSIPWLFAMFTTIGMYLYLLTQGLLHLLKLKKENTKLISVIAAVISLAAIYLIPDFSWAMKLRDLIRFPTYLFVYIIPLLTLLLSIIRGKKGSAQ